MDDADTDTAHGVVVLAVYNLHNYIESKMYTDQTGQFPA